MFWSKPKGTKYTLKIEGMVCDHCAAHIATELRKVEGAEGVKVSRKHGEAVVYAPDGYEEKLRECIADTGYDLVSISRE